jgi:CubicO group peptidase (beta-lactamase class C family)
MRLLMIWLLATSSLSVSRQSVPASLAAIEQFVAEQFAAGHFPGMAVVVVRGDELVLTQALGIAAPNGRPVTMHTPFGIGSMTKSFTALAVLQLVEAGQIDLDAPLQRYLPDFRLADPAAARIAARHLLHQTSGLPTAAGFWNGDGIEPAGQPAARMRALADTRLAHPPDVEHTYSNANYDLAGLLIEQVSGQPYEQVIDERILSPLRMSDSAVVTVPGQLADSARGFQSWYGLALPSAQTMLNRGVAPGGGIFSSAADMGRYLSAHLDAGRGSSQRLLSAAGFATLHTAAPGTSYAMGWSEREVAGRPMLLHNGGSPDFTGTMLILPEDGWGVAVLTNLNAFSAGLTPLPTREIAAGIASLLLGSTPEIGGFAGIRTELFLRWFILGAAVWGTLTTPFNLRRWRRRYEQQPHPARASLAIGFDLLLAAVFALILPLLAGIPLWAALRFNPDITLLLLVAIVSQIAQAAYRLVVLCRVRSGGQVPLTRSSAP